MSSINNKTTFATSDQLIKQVLRDYDVTIQENYDTNRTWESERRTYGNAMVNKMECRENVEFTVPPAVRRLPPEPGTADAAGGAAVAEDAAGCGASAVGWWTQFPDELYKAWGLLFPGKISKDKKE